MDQIVKKLGKFPSYLVQPTPLLLSRSLYRMKVGTTRLRIVLQLSLEITGHWFNGSEKKGEKGAQFHVAKL